MSEVVRVEVPAREARVVEVRRGQVLDVIDVCGQQVGDLVAFRADDPDEALSPAHTCSVLTRLVPQVGDAFVSTRRRPLLRIVRDDVGRHDLVVPCCDPQRYEGPPLDAPGHANCLDALQAALGDRWTVRGELAVNVFMNNVLEDGRIVTKEPPHGAGSTLSMEALDDLVVCLVACPQDLTPCNAFDPTPMALEVRG